MLYPKATLLAAVRQHVASNAAADAFIEQAGIDFLNAVLPIAPEASVWEVLKHTLNALIPSSGIGDVTIKEGSGGTSTGVFKIVSVYQSSDVNLTGSRFRAQHVSLLQLDRMIEGYPKTSPALSGPEVRWALDEGGQRIKLYAGTAGWFVVPVFLQVPAWEGANVEIPAGWQTAMVNYAISRIHERDEQVELAAQYKGEMAQDLAKFGVYFDAPKSHAGAGKA